MCSLKVYTPAVISLTFDSTVVSFHIHIKILNYLINMYPILVVRCYGSTCCCIAGIDLGRFVDDAEYKRETILGLAM